MNDQITTAAELDSLPMGSVVRCDDAEGIGLNVCERHREGWQYVGSALHFSSAQVASDELEFTVLYRPDQPQRVQPSREDVARRILDKTVGVVDCELHERLMTPMWDRATSAADAVLALFAQQPTVAEVKAEAWDQAITAAADALDDGHAIYDLPNPYRQEADHA